MRIIQGVTLGDKDDKFTIDLQLDENPTLQNLKQPVKLQHQIITDMYFTIHKQGLSVEFKKNQLKDINPYKVLMKIIDKIFYMNIFYLRQKESFNQHAIVKNHNFFWICVDVDLQFFEKTSSQHHQSPNQDQFKGRISNTLFANLYDEINKGAQEEDLGSNFILQIIKKVDRDPSFYPPEMFSDEEVLFLNQIYSITDIIIFNLESLGLILYLIYFGENKNTLYDQKDQYLDYYFLTSCIKFLPQNKTISMNIMRFFQNYHYDKKCYFDEIEQNPCNVYKNMPFTITFNMADCFECVQSYMAMMKERMHAGNTEKPLVQREKVKNHTRSIELQINVIQNIFQNSYMLTSSTREIVYLFLRDLQQIYCTVLDQIDKFYGMGMDQTQNKIFEFKEKQIIGSLLNQKPHTVTTILIKYTSMDKLEMVFKNIKVVTCQLQKFLRYIYFMHLIGKDPNNMASLQENKPTIITNLSEDLKKQYIMFAVTRQGLDFNLAMKYRYEMRGQNLLYYVSNYFTDKNGLKDQIENEYRESLLTIFKSMNNPDIETFTLERQIRHVTNYYNVIQAYYKNSSDKDYQLNQYIVNCVRILDRYKIIYDFSKKDMDIPNFENKSPSKPKYLLELISYYDTQRHTPIRAQSFFAKDSENRLFIMVKKPTSTDYEVLTQINIQQMQEYIQDFLKSYFNIP